MLGFTHRHSCRAGRSVCIPIGVAVSQVGSHGRSAESPRLRRPNYRRKRVTGSRTRFSSTGRLSLYPAVGAGGGPPDRLILQTYRPKTAVPGSVTVEWPRLYLRLDEVTIDGEPAIIDPRFGVIVAQWDNYVRQYAPDGHPISEGGGNYSTTVLIEPTTRRVTVKRPDK